MRLLLGEGLIEDALGRGVQARIGHRIEPMAQLGVQVVEIAARAGKEEVLADIAIGPLYLSLGFGPIRPAGLGLVAIVPSKINQRPVVDDAAASFADDGGLHPVVENLIGDASIASNAAIWQRRTVCMSWCRTNRPQINRLKPSTNE